MAEIMTVVIADAESIWDDPQSGSYIEFKVDGNNNAEYRFFLDLVEFLAEKGLYAYACFDDGTRINASRAFHDMKELEKRYPDV